MASESKSETMGPIPVNTPTLHGNEKKYLMECIDTNWISTFGPFVKKFETAMAEACGRKHAVAVTNGSAAIDVAVAALGLKEGDEVIMPTFTIISCICEFARRNITVRFVDCDEHYRMKVADIEPLINENTKAIMVVHIYHFPVDMDPVLALAKKHNLKVIEDAAQMIGQTYKGKPCGGFGDVSTMSFYPNKHVTTGEGGMVLCNDDDLHEKIVQFKNLCFIPPRRFIHKEIGWNNRMTNMQAALGLAQVEVLPETIVRKRHIGNLYLELLEGTRGLVLPTAEVDGEKNVFWVFGLLLTDEVKADAVQVMAELAKRKIGCRPFFYPLHKQPVFVDAGKYADESHPFSEVLGERGFYIPSGLGLTDEQQRHVAKNLKEVIAGFIDEE